MSNKLLAPLDQLQVAIQNRVQHEADFAARFLQGASEAEKALISAIQSIHEQRVSWLEQLEQHHQEAITQITGAIDCELMESEGNLQAELGETNRACDADREEVEAKYQDSTWVTSSLLDDTADDSPKREYEKVEFSITKQREELSNSVNTLDADAQSLMDQRGWNREVDFEPPTAPKNLEKLSTLVQETHERAFGELKSARSLLMPKLILGRGSIVFFLLIGVGIGTAFFLLTPPQAVGITNSRNSPEWLAISAGVGVVASLILTSILYFLASSSQNDALSQVKATLSELGWLMERWNQIADRDLQEAQSEFQHKQEQYERQKQQALARYQKAHLDRLAEIEEQRASKTIESKRKFADQKALLEAQKSTQLAALDTQMQMQRQTGEQHLAEGQAKVQAELEQCQSDHRRRQAEAWAALKTGWEQSFQRVNQQVIALQENARQSSPPWDDLESKSWSPAKEIPSSYTIGQHRIPLDQWPGAISSDMRLAPRTSELVIPSTVDFPAHASLLLQWSGPQGRSASVQALQVAMLRLLTQIPPGKIRFTLIDPVGLGESFGGFMHLADVDELLVTSRIWTEAGQIEARLADLTEHMENVLQTYLRNEFATIEDYNHHAGEVAEPYRFLVISDFPAKFSEIAASRLLSIITSGPRCGVYTLMSVDMGREIPQQLPLATVAENMTCYQWTEGGFRLGNRLDVNASLLSPWPLDITPTPSPEQFTRIVKQMAEASRDARRVEVSFERIAPKEHEFWSKDSRAGIDIPLGRAGATKLQHLKLGQGTSQHMLVAGKTGSGKSTFLHTLIVNTALYYNPNEVNFYLIDFKKGVEFKDYASLQLPHGRVVAIESDREFGVSALQKLDAVLQERGELFRKHGVQDIRGFRDANPNTPLPRLLLVIDEFQEFFVEDDKLAQTASLLLDRLVRQGRAFGMHVILGSQTLGGAYSLARSTLGQVAIRVALQCSEADAHLILSEENTAARLLTRPGEAIYNDANGLIEGNHPFQVAFLSDKHREDLLRDLAHQSRKAMFKLESPIIFEGNIPSDPTRNVALHRLLEGVDGSTALRITPRIWLGDAVEIKQPTELTFPRQSGSHLLLIGQDSEAALGLMSTAVVALAGQLQEQESRNRQRPEEINFNDNPSLESDFPGGMHPPLASVDQPSTINHQPVLTGGLTPPRSPSIPSILIFDGSPVDSPDAELWRSVSKAVPNVQLVTSRQALDVLRQLTEVQQARDADRETNHPPVFVFVSQLSKFRDLRKPDDDYSFGGFGGGEAAAPSGGKLFADLIANGPENGIHFILWCDSYNNLERWLSRQSLREMERRILFQMNAADSSNLIDSPVASRLGTHRALLHFQESGAIEKFRPYGLPTAVWLDWAARCLQKQGPLDEATDLDEFMVS